MWKEAVAETGIIFYLMLGVGIVGILAKVMNYVTLRKLVNAAGSMSKYTQTDEACSCKIRTCLYGT